MALIRPVYCAACFLSQLQLSVGLGGIEFQQGRTRSCCYAGCNVPAIISYNVVSSLPYCCSCQLQQSGALRGRLSGLFVQTDRRGMSCGNLSALCSPSPLQRDSLQLAQSMFATHHIKVCLQCTAASSSPKQGCFQRLCWGQPAIATADLQHQSVLCCLCCHTQSA